MKQFGLMALPARRGGFWPRWVNWLLRSINLVGETVSIRRISWPVELAAREYVRPEPGESRILQLAAESEFHVAGYSDLICRPPLFHAELENCTLWGDCGAIGTDRAIVIESMLDFRVCARSSAYRNPRLRRTSRKAGRHSSIFYGPALMGNVYHWMIDCLPRLYPLSRADRKDLTLVCHRGMSPLQRRTLAAFIERMPELRIAEIGTDERWELERYLFPSFATGRYNSYLHPEALSFLREGLGRVGGSPGGEARVGLYISRAAASRRRIANEAEIVAMLESLSFVTVQAERHNVDELATLFRRARCIVGVHGAGLSNMVFASDCRIVELFPQDSVRPHYLLLAKALGFRYDAMVGERSNRGREFRVDPEKLRALLA